MKNRFNFGFFVSAFACAVILNTVSVWDLKFALHEMGPMLLADVGFRDAVANKCGILHPGSASVTEKYILEHFPLPQKEVERGECTLLAQSAHATRLRLRDYWDFQVQVRDADNVPIADRHFAVDFPRPLVLLPLVLFLLALVFEFRRWGLGATVLSYIFLACGANLILAVQRVSQATRTLFTSEQSWAGIFLIGLFVALCRGRKTKQPQTAIPTVKQKLGNRALIGAVALWNPVVFTLGGRLLLPFRGSLQRVAPFLSFQVAAVCLSVYLLTLGSDGISAFFSKSLWMPRYFTFSALLFLILHHGKIRREPLTWEMPGFSRMVLGVVIVEAWAFHSNIWEGTSNLTRIGIGLVAGQLAWPFEMDWKRVGKEIVRWGGPLFLGALLTVLSTQTSVADLVLLGVDPRQHPTGAAFFTFLCGICLGFVSGGFATAFFTLFMATTKADTLAVVQAALLDGILAGILLSPFSLLNLIPAAQFGVSIQAIVVQRFRILALPLLIAALIYAVSAITSVAILRPATFLFLCLVAVVVQLKRSRWRLGNYTISPDLRNAEH